MRRHTALSRFVVLGALFAVLPAAGVRAEGDDATAGGVWAYDVRVVRVDVSLPDLVEQPLWGESVTISKPWEEILAVLKARGATTLLLDKRVTSVAGLPATVRQRTQFQWETLQNRDLSNTRWASTILGSGASATLMSAELFEYDVEANWLLPAAHDNGQPTTASAEWRGTHPLLDGRTLALRDAQQLGYPFPARVGVEIHVFITGRFVSGN